MSRMCSCGVRPFEYTDHVRNVLVYECSQKFKKNAKSCTFQEVLELGPKPVFEVSVSLDSMYISEDAKKFKQLLESNTLDRNMIIWYMLNKDVGQYVTEASQKIKEIDKVLLQKFRGFLLSMKTIYHSSFSIIYEIIDYLKRYVGVPETELGELMKDISSKNGTSRIVSFYEQLTKLLRHIEHNGFEYVPPVFGGVYNAKQKEPPPSIIERRGYELPPLILEDGADNDMFESDEEDRHKSDGSSVSSRDSNPMEFDSESVSESGSDADILKEENEEEMVEMRNLLKKFQRK